MSSKSSWPCCFFHLCLEDFSALIRTWEKKKKEAWHLLNSCYDAVHNFFGYHRKMNTNQSNNCFHEWHPHSLHSQGFRVWESLRGACFVTATPATCKHTHTSSRCRNDFYYFIIFLCLFSLDPWSQSGKFQVRQNLYTDESISSNVYICVCPSHAQIPYGNSGASV